MSHMSRTGSEKTDSSLQRLSGISLYKRNIKNKNKNMQCTFISSCQTFEFQMVSNYQKELFSYVGTTLVTGLSVSRHLSLFNS